MSATISWRVVDAGLHTLPVDAPSAFRETLRELNLSDTFGPGDVHVFRAMAKSGANDAKAFKVLADAIDKYGEIEIVVQY